MFKINRLLYLLFCFCAPHPIMRDLFCAEFVVLQRLAKIEVQSIFSADHQGCDRLDTHRTCSQCEHTH